jgi:hypothetical protein
MDAATSTLIGVNAIRWSIAALIAAFVVTPVVAPVASAQSASELSREEYERLRGEISIAIATAEGRRQAEDDARRLANGIDPSINALRDCDHAARNASGAPWSTKSSVERCAEARKNGGQGSSFLQGSVGACWGHYDTALSALEAAAELYEQARHVTSPQQGQLMRQARARHQEGNQEIQQGANCLQRTLTLAVQISKIILDEVGNGRGGNGGDPRGGGGGSTPDPRVPRNPTDPDRTPPTNPRTPTNPNDPTSPTRGTPPDDPRALPDSHRKDVWPPLLAVNDVLEHISDYDMRKPHTGAKIIVDSLTSMAMNWVLKGAAAAVRNMFGKAGDDVAQAIEKTVQEGQSAKGGGTGGGRYGSNGPGGQGIPPATTWQTPPPGVTVPRVLQTTPRPVYPMETSQSCVIACAKMVGETVTRRSLPESWLRQLSRGDVIRAGLDRTGYAPGAGTYLESLPRLFNLMGVRTSGVVNATVDDLARATNNGYPALAGVLRGNQQHAIIVDAVVSTPNGRFLFIRDPINFAHMDAMTQQFVRQAGFSNQAVVAEADFLDGFLGRAVMTVP